MLTYYAYYVNIEHMKNAYRVVVRNLNTYALVLGDYMWVVLLHVVWCAS